MKNINQDQYNKDTLNYINRLISDYISRKKTDKNYCLKKLGYIVDKPLLYRALDARIQIKQHGKTKEKLLRLGFSLNRERYLTPILKYATENDIELSDMGIYESFQSFPITENEMEQVIDYIIACKDFEPRMVKYLTAEKLVTALEGVLEHSREYGIRQNQLIALSKNRSYLMKVQPQLRDKMDLEVFTTWAWLRFLVLDVAENQEFIESHCSIYDVYKYAKPWEYDEKFENCFTLRIVKQIKNRENISTEDWNVLKSQLRGDVNEIEHSNDPKMLFSILEELEYYDHEFVESSLAIIYKNSVTHRKTAFDSLKKIGSLYAYREMINIIISTEDRYERFHNAVQVVFQYPAKIPYLLEYCNDLGDEKLIQRIKELAVRVGDEKKQSKKTETRGELATIPSEMKILHPTTIIPELINSISSRIHATVFFAAVGFVFASGMKLLLPTINSVLANGGRVELVSGSLQNFKNKAQNTKIDKKTVELLNKLIKDKVELYTVEDRFYHGKFYYIANDHQAYVIIGSSNISKTAYVCNFELDVLIPVDCANQEHNQCLEWYNNLKDKCSRITNLEPDHFIDLKWQSELEAFTEKFLKRISAEEVYNRIIKVTDEKLKHRLELWMAHTPAVIYEDFGVPALGNYILLLFPNYSLAVFETFESDNAYYTFEYTDIELLLQKAANLSKAELRRQSEFLRKGNHIKNVDSLTNKIEQYFIRSEEY